MTTDHLSEATIRQFVAGKLSAEAANAAMAHLSECEACLAGVDAQWTAQPAAADAPDLSDQVAARMERQLIKRIRRSNLAGTILSMGTIGFSQVAMALVRPLMARRPPNTPESKLAEPPEQPQ